MNTAIFDIDMIRQLSRELSRRRETVAVAESVTAGLLQNAFAGCENASEFFQGGITTYNADQKYKHLHVDIVNALKCNCVSEQTAVEMASNVSRLFGTNWGIAVTGYASALPGHIQNGLFAFFSITYNHELKYTGRIITHDQPVFDVQLEYTNHILNYFLDNLKKEI